MTCFKLNTSNLKLSSYEDEYDVRIDSSRCVALAAVMVSSLAAGQNGPAADNQTPKEERAS